MDVQNFIRSSIFLLSLQMVQAVYANPFAHIEQSTITTPAPAALPTNKKPVQHSAQLFSQQKVSTAQQAPASYMQMIFVPTIPTTSSFSDTLNKMYSSTDLPESTLQELQQVYFVLEYFAKLEKIQHDKTYASLQTKYASLLSSAARDIPFISQGMDLANDTTWQNIKITQQDVINSDMWQYFLKATIADIFVHNGNFLQVIHEVETQIFNYIPSMETSYYNSDFLGLRNLAEGTRLKLLLNDQIRAKHQAQTVDWAKLSSQQLQTASVAFQSTDFYNYSHNINLWMQQNAQGAVVSQKKVSLQSPTKEQVFFYAMIKAAQNDLYAALAVSNNLENFLLQASSSSLLPNIFEYTVDEFVYLDDFFMIQANLATQIEEANQATAPAKPSSSNSVSVQSLQDHPHKKKRKKYYKTEDLVKIQDYTIPAHANLVNPAGATNPLLLELDYTPEQTVSDFHYVTSAADFFNQAGSEIVSGLESFGNSIVSAAQTLGGDLENDFISAGYAIRDGFIQAGYAIRDSFKSAGEAIGGLGATVIGDIANDPNLQKIGHNLTQQAASDMAQAGTELNNAIDDYFTAIEDGIVAPYADIGGAIVSVLTQDQSLGLDTATMINQVVDSVYNVAQTYANLLVSGYTGLAVDAIVVTTDIADAIVKSVAAMNPDNRNGVGDAWSQLGNDMGMAVLGAIQGLVTASKEMFAAIMQVMTALTSAITTIIIDVSKEATFLFEALATGNIQEAKAEENAVGTYLDDHRQTINMVSGIILAVAIDVAVTVATGGAGTAEAVALTEGMMVGETAAEAGVEAGTVAAEAATTAAETATTAAETAASGARAATSIARTTANVGEDAANIGDSAITAGQAATNAGRAATNITRNAVQESTSLARTGASATDDVASLGESGASAARNAVSQTKTAATPTAETSAETATESSAETAGNAAKTAGNATKSTKNAAQAAKDTATTARSTATAARASANTAKETATTARTAASTARAAANKAEQAASQAEAEGAENAGALRTAANEADQEATTAESVASKADEAATKAETAASKAESAATKAEQAAIKAAGRITRSWTHVAFSEVFNATFNILGAIGASYQDEMAAVKEISQEEGVKNIVSYAMDTALNSSMQQNAMMQETEKKLNANIANQQLGLLMLKDFVANAIVNASYQSEAVGLGQEYASLLTPQPYDPAHPSITYYPADIGATWGLTTAINSLYPQLGLYTTTLGRPKFPYAQEIAQAPLIIDSQSGQKQTTNIDGSSQTQSISQLWFNQRVMIPLASQKATDPLQVEVQFRKIYGLETTTYTGLYLGGIFENYRSKSYLDSLETTGMANLNVAHLAKMFVLIHLPNGTTNIGVYEKDGLGTIKDETGASWIIYEPLDQKFSSGWPIYDMKAKLQGNQLTLTLSRADMQSLAPWQKTITVSPTDQRMLGIIASGTAIEFNVLQPTLPIKQSSIRTNPSSSPISITEEDREIQSLQTWSKLLSPKFGNFKLAALSKFACMNGKYVYTTTSTQMKDANDKVVTDYMVFANYTTSGATNVGLNPYDKTTSSSNLALISLGSGNVYDTTGKIIGSQKNVWDSYNKAHGPFADSITSSIAQMQAACLQALLKPKVGIFTLQAADSTMISDGLYVYTTPQTLTQKDSKNPILDYLVTCAIDTTADMNGNPIQTPGDTIGAPPSGTTQGFLSLVTGNLYTINSLTPVNNGYDGLGLYQSSYKNLPASITKQISDALTAYTAATTPAAAQTSSAQQTAPAKPQTPPVPPKAIVFGSTSSLEISNSAAASDSTSFNDTYGSSKTKTQTSAQPSAASITLQQQVASAGIAFSMDLMSGTATSEALPDNASIDTSGSASSNTAPSQTPAKKKAAPTQAATPPAQASAAAPTQTTSTASATTIAAKPASTNSSNKPASTTSSTQTPAAAAKPKAANTASSSKPATTGTTTTAATKSVTQPTSTNQTNSNQGSKKTNSTATASGSNKKTTQASSSSSSSSTASQNGSVVGQTSQTYAPGIVFNI